MLSQVHRMIRSLEHINPTAGRDGDVDAVWAEGPVRAAATKVIAELRAYRQSIVEAQTVNDQTSNNALGDVTEKQIYPRSLAQQIANSIYVPAEDDPDYPEFPPESPKFPATPVVEVNFDGCTFLIKDESRNPTGTHKDRWAWEMIVRVKELIEGEIKRSDEDIHIPRYSMISSGSAAYALQCILRRYGLPELHTVVDTKRTKRRVVVKLEAAGSKVYHYNLERKLLSEADVLVITENPLGEDVTPRLGDEPFKERFYDWLVYEILNCNPKHIFVPFGTGGLFSNVIYIIDAELNGRCDPRLQLPREALLGINVYGATSDDPETQMEMLYAPFRPTQPAIEQSLRDFIASGTLGRHSAIVRISDAQARRALALAPVFDIRSDLSGVAALALLLDRLPKLPRGESAIAINTGCIFLPPL